MDDMLVMCWFFLCGEEKREISESSGSGVLVGVLDCWIAGVLGVLDTHFSVCVTLGFYFGILSAVFIERVRKMSVKLSRVELVVVAF